MIRFVQGLGIVMTFAASAGAVDCLAVVNYYEAKQAEQSDMPDVFLGWNGTASLPHFRVDRAINSTDLLCDYKGQVQRLRYAWSWTEAETDQGDMVKTFFSMLALADAFALGSPEVVEAFARTAESYAVEVEDLPGPYQVSVEAAVLAADRGSLTIILERDP
jgi:hypothetical protein